MHSHHPIGPSPKPCGIGDPRKDSSIGPASCAGRSAGPAASCCYRADIGDGDALAVEVHRFRHLYNTIRPHQALAGRTPAQVYTAPGGGPGLVSA